MLVKSLLLGLEQRVGRATIFQSPLVRWWIHFTEAHCGRRTATSQRAPRRGRERASWGSQRPKAALRKHLSV
eukprot:9437593-Alexandrium_andersonii.AAC.1